MLRGLVKMDASCQRHHRVLAVLAAAAAVVVVAVASDAPAMPGATPTKTMT